MRSAESIANDLTPFITANNGSVGETNRRLVLIGDGQGNVQPPTLLTPRDVLYRSAVDQNDRGIAILHPKCPIALDSLYGYANVEVYIANVPGSSQLYIVDVADTGLRGSGGATSTEGLTRTAAFPTQDRLVIGRLRLSPAGGLAILVDFGVPGYQTAYEIPSGGYGFTSTAGIDLSDPTNATIFTGGGAALASGEHCIVGVAFDPTLGALIAIQGTPVTAVDSLPSRSEFAEADYEAIDFTGFYPCGYTYNYYGQTDFVEDDMLRLYDPRLFMKVMGGGGGGGSVTDVTATSPLSSSGGATPDISHDDSAVTPGSYTSANITVDDKGHIQAASNGSGGGSPANAYFNILAALLEPDALEVAQIGTFTYVIGAGVTKLMLASFQCALGASGLLEVRNPAEYLPLSDVTVTGLGSTASAVFLDPTIPTYADAWTTYYDRLSALTVLKTRFLNFTAASQILPFLTGAYGAIVMNISYQNLTWVGMFNSGISAGFNLWNEKGNTGSTDMLNASNRMMLALNKLVVNAIKTGANSGGSALATITYVLLPSTWSEVTDPLAPYDFRDDFMGASINTGSVWTRVQSTAGNVEINTDYQWCGLIGNTNWNANAMYSQYSQARTVGKVYLVDVYIGADTNPQVLVGWSDGAGQDYTNFAYGLIFTSGGNFDIYENGTHRQTFTGAWTSYNTYRIRITIASSNAAVYEVQGGPEHPALGGGSWGNVTPGTTSSTSTPLHAGVATANSAGCFVSDVRIY